MYSEHNICLKDNEQFACGNILNTDASISKVPVKWGGREAYKNLPVYETMRTQRVMLKTSFSPPTMRPAAILKLFVFFFY